MLNYQRVSQSMASQSCWSLSVAGYCDGCRLGLRISQDLTFDGTNTGHILHSILYGSRTGKSTFGMSPQRSSRSWVGGPMYGHMWSHGWTPCLFLQLLRYESAVFRVSHTIFASAQVEFREAHFHLLWTRFHIELQSLVQDSRQRSVARACGVRGSVVGEPCRWLPCLWKQRWRPVAMNLNRSWVPSGNQRWSCLMGFPFKFADSFPIQTCQPCLIEGKCCAMAIFWACAGNIPSLQPSFLPDFQLVAKHESLPLNPRIEFHLRRTGTNCSSIPLVLSGPIRSSGSGEDRFPRGRQLEGRYPTVRWHWFLATWSRHPGRDVSGFPMATSSSWTNRWKQLDLQNCKNLDLEFFFFKL